MEQASTNLPVAKVTGDSKKPVVIFLLSGAVLFLVAMWFAIATMDYRASQSGLRSLRTSGSFIFGMILLLPLGIGYGALFLFLSGWTGKPIAFGCLLLASSVLVTFAVNSASPTVRLKAVVGNAAVEVASIERLLIADSLNDGQFYAGVLSGPTNLISLILTYRSLQSSLSQGHLKHFPRFLKDVDLPEVGEFLTDSHGTFLVSPDKHRIYFFHASRTQSWEE